MKKSISLLLCILLALGISTSCSKEPTANETETTPAGITITETAAPETAVPETAAPETAAPETAAPETAAPETAAPETAAPETAAPETAAPETADPETEAPSDAPIEMNWDEAFTAEKYGSMYYRLYLPEGYSEDEEYPLFVYLHSGRRGGTDNQKPLEEVKMFFEHPESPLYDSIVLVPQTSYESLMWRGKDKDTLMRLTKKINETYSTDLNRQYYVGSLEGGDAVWDLMELYPERISACVSSMGKGIHFLKYPDGTLSPVEYFESMAEIPLGVAYNDDGYSSIGMKIGKNYFTLLYDFLVEKGAENLFFKEITEYTEDKHNLVLADSEDISMLTWLYDQSRPTSMESETGTPSYTRVKQTGFNASEEFTVDSFTASNGVTLAYGYYIPEGYDESKDYPLLTFLHGDGTQGSDGHRHLARVNNFFAHPDSPVFDSLVLMPQCPEGEWWAGESIDAVIELMDDFNSRFSTDLSRQYVTGSSMGGNGTWDIAARYPEHVSGAVPVAGEGGLSIKWNPDGTTTPEFDPRILEIPIFYIYDTYDEYSMSYIQRSHVRILEDYGAKYFTYRETTGLGHDICGTHVSARDISALEWLYAQRRDTTVPIVPVDPVPYAATGTEATDSEQTQPEVTIDPDFEGLFMAEEYGNMLYRLHLPEGYSEDKEYPLFVYLHSFPLRGTDNKKPLIEAKMFFEHPESPLYDSIVLIPQTNDNTIGKPMRMMC